MAGLRLSPGKPTQRSVTTMGYDLVVGEDHLWGRVVSGITGNRAGEALWPLAAHLGEG